MKFKAGFLVGLGAGYVLGARAGQERYHQIVETTRSFRENPGVQRLTGEVNKTVSVGKERVGEKAAEQASRAKEAVASAAKKSDDDPFGAGTAPAATTSSSATP